MSRGLVAREDGDTLEVAPAREVHDRMDFVIAIIINN